MNRKKLLVFTFLVDILILYIFIERYFNNSGKGDLYTILISTLALFYFSISKMYMKNISKESKKVFLFNVVIIYLITLGFYLKGILLWKK